MAGLAAHPELGSLAGTDSQTAQHRTCGQPSHFCGWDASRGLGARGQSLAGPTRRPSLDGRTHRPSLDGPTRRPSLAGPARRPGLDGRTHRPSLDGPRAAQVWLGHAARSPAQLAKPVIGPRCPAGRSDAWLATRPDCGPSHPGRRSSRIAQLGAATPSW